MKRRSSWWLASAVLVAVLALLYWQSPRGGAFWWSDAARHALNSAFVADLLRDRPWQDPVGYAYHYYAQYPALTILFYPPLLYALTAPFYLLFGVSHEVALLVVFLHYFAFGLGCWRLARCWLAPLPALAFALLMVLMPEIALWGRQVMTEVPAYAFLVWSLVAFVEHRRSGRIGWLYLSAALLVLAMNTKLTVGFVGLVYLAVLARDQGLGLLRRGHHWAIAALTLAQVNDALRRHIDPAKWVVIWAGDFFGAGRGSWFDLALTKQLAKGLAELQAIAQAQGVERLSFGSLDLGLDLNLTTGSHAADTLVQQIFFIKGQGSITFFQCRNGIIVSCVNVLL